MPSPNRQLFALPDGPPATLDIAGAHYCLARVFKHDFFAATCLYETDQGERFPRIVAKFSRHQPFCGVPLAWAASFLRDHEEAIYKALEGVQGVPALVGRIGESAFAMEFIDARPLDHNPPPPAGFFDQLAQLLSAVHARGVAYADANKRSNFLIAPDGRPFVIDFQISLRLRNDLPWPIRAVIARAVRYLMSKDIYHLYKHKRRIAPQELTPQQDALSRHLTGLHLIHRKLTTVWRSGRRLFLKSQFQKGALTSPTAALEDHHQPEKDTWRKME